MKIRYCKNHRRLYLTECYKCIEEQDFLNEYNNEMFWQSQNR